MIFKHFRSGIILRVLLLAASILAIGIGVLHYHKHFNFLSISLLVLIVCFQVLNLIRYAEQVNKKLSLFLGSVRHSDFQINFDPGQTDLGESFEEVFQSFDEVVASFKRTRAEREAVLQFLDTIIRQVNTGLMVMDDSGEITLSNPVAYELLGVDKKLRNRRDLEQLLPQFYDFLTALKEGPLGHFRLGEEVHLLVKKTIINLQEKPFTLISFHNIKAELQQKETEAWQKLISVLRHEIMNAIAPIATYTSTLREVAEKDFVQKGETMETPIDAYETLQEGLNTIEDRSLGLMRFVEAYRSFTKLPPLKIERLAARSFLENALQLMQADLIAQGINSEVLVSPPTLQLDADEAQLNMVLLNLLKNAIEALTQTDQPRIRLTAQPYGNGIEIRLIDNGPGIPKTKQEDIFVPFFSSKTNGSGIGLSLSRQILQLHGGSLELEDGTPGRTTFRIRLE